MEKEIEHQTENGCHPRIGRGNRRIREETTEAGESSEAREVTTIGEAPETEVGTMIGEGSEGFWWVRVECRSKTVVTLFKRRSKFRVSNEEKMILK